MPPGVLTEPAEYRHRGGLGHKNKPRERSKEPRANRARLKDKDCEETQLWEKEETMKTGGLHTIGTTVVLIALLLFPVYAIRGAKQHRVMFEADAETESHEQQHPRQPYENQQHMQHTRLLVRVPSSSQEAVTGVMTSRRLNDPFEDEELLDNLRSQLQENGNRLGQNDSLSSASKHSSDITDFYMVAEL